MTQRPILPPGQKWIVKLADLTPEERALVLAALDLHRKRPAAAPTPARGR